MSYFCDNICPIINNLVIADKLYFVSLYIKTIEEVLDDKTILIKIYLKAIALNKSEHNVVSTANVSGTTNTVVGIDTFYINLLNSGIDLIYKNLASINGFEGCNSNNSITNYNPYNNINLVTSNLMKFKFDILNQKVDRQGGQTVDAYIEYQYNCYYKGPNYENIRNYIIKVLTSTINPDTYWENLCIYIAHNVLSVYKDLSGIKINLVVKNNPDGTIPEPGDHGPTYVFGIFN